MVAHVCQSLGWDWETAEDQLTIERLETLNAYWDDHPAPHLLLAGFVGHKPKGGSRKKRSKRAKDEQFREFIKAFGTGTLRG